MPHVRRSVLVTLDAPAETVREALANEMGPTSSVGPFEGTTLAAEVAPVDDRTSTLRLDARGHYDVPFFAWFVDFQAWLAARSELASLADRVQARIDASAPRAP